MDQEFKNQVLKDIGTIKIRNFSLDAQYAWEQSISHKAIIALSTYVVSLVFFIVGGYSYPLENALVPTIGLLASSVSFNTVKRRWIAYYLRKKQLELHEREQNYR